MGGRDVVLRANLVLMPFWSRRSRAQFEELKSSTMPTPGAAGGRPWTGDSMNASLRCRMKLLQVSLWRNVAGQTRDVLAEI